MPIRVTCPGCHTRFNVSDKFAGQEGPCPKCKKPIKIPEAGDEVKIHTPQEFGPKDKTGTQTLKPLTRKETKVTPVGAILVIVPVVVFLLLALVARSVFSDPARFPVWLLVLGALLMSGAVVFAGYTFLRDQERGVFTGNDLYLRVGICAVLYALLWIAMPLAGYAFNGYGLGSWVTAFVAMFALGAAICMYSFELDYLVGILHFGLYMACCLIMRLAAGVGALPGSVKTAPVNDNPVPTDTPGTDVPGIPSDEGGMGMILEFLEPFFC